MNISSGVNFSRTAQNLQTNEHYLLHT